MSESRIVRQSAKPEFKVGEVVELDPTQFDVKDLYVVVVTDSRDKMFSGTILHANTPDVNHHIGHHSSSFTKDCFVKFSGKVEVAQL